MAVEFEPLSNRWKEDPYPMYRVLRDEAPIHLGASLARLEAVGARTKLLPQLPKLERVTPEREFLDSFLIRGRRRLELRAVS